MRKAIIAAALLLLACGSSSGTGPDGGSPGGNPGSTTPQGTGSMNGTILGNSLTPQDVLSTSDSTGAVIFITDVVGFCGDLQLGYKLKNGSVLLLVLEQTDGSGTTIPVTPGTYPIVPEGQLPPGTTAASADFAKLDSSCSNTVDSTSASGVSGNVTVTQVTSAGVSGSYDLTTGSGDHVTGTFEGAACSYTPRSSTTCP